MGSQRQGVRWLKFMVIAAMGMGTGGVSSVGANEVTARFVGSELRVEGDTNANQITVRQNTNGSLVIAGRGGTRVNGGNAFSTTRSVASLEIRLGAGDDSVVVQGLNIPGDLDIYLGEGNNRVTGNTGTFAVGGSVDIFGGNQRDLVTLSNWSIVGDLDIDLLDGPSQVNVSSSQVGGNLDVYGGAQSDRFTLTDLFVGIDVDVETFASRDIVDITSLDARSLDILTDSGNDDVTLSNVVLTLDLDIITGAGNDSVNVEAVAAERDVEILLGAGNDTLIVMGLMAMGELFLHGQAGAQDILVDGGFQGLREVIVLGFESGLL